MLSVLATVAVMTIFVMLVGVLLSKRQPFAAIPARSHRG